MNSSRGTGSLPGRSFARISNDDICTVKARGISEGLGRHYVAGYPELLLIEGGGDHARDICSIYILVRHDRRLHAAPLIITFLQLISISAATNQEVHYWQGASRFWSLKEAI